VGAAIRASQLPPSADLAACAGPAEARRLLLVGGDDYELLFTLPPGVAPPDAGDVGVRLSCLGAITAARGVTLDGAPLARELAHGFDHFA
jgi:thiamine-monophosphate kinase